MQRQFLTKGMIAAILATGLFACEKDDAVVVPPPSNGQTQTLNGGAGGASAVNSVYVDLSTDKQDSIKRNSWDLAFYSGSSFRVGLNSTNGASAVMVNKTDINSVTSSDIVLDDLAIALGTAGAFDNIDDIVTGDIGNTVIAEISATDANNKVYVINTEGGSHTATLSLDKLIKVRILRKGNGYTLQYAKLSETTFKTVDILKDAAYNFKHFSFTSNALVNAEPEKAKWDIMWTWSIYYGGTGAGAYPYGYSDVVFTNVLSGAQTAEKIYANSTVRNSAYDAYTADSLATVSFNSSFDAIGSKWRATTGTIGVKTDRFYLVKDAAGNVYKLKFISFTTQDGGVRGKPVIEYKLVKKG